MKKASRFLTLLLVAVFVLSIFSGCSLFGRNTEKYRSQVAIIVGNENITVGKLIDTYNSYYNTYASYVGTYVTLDDIFEMAVSSLYSQYTKIDAYKNNANTATYQHSWLDVTLENQEYLNDTELKYGVKYIKYILFSTLDTMVESYIDSDYTLQDAEDDEEEEDTSRDFYEFDDLEGAQSYSEYTYNQTFVNEDMDEYLLNYYDGILKDSTLDYSDYVYNTNITVSEELAEKFADLNDRIEGSDPIDVAKYAEYQAQALKQYEKNVKISYDYDLATLINRQLEDYINSVIVAKYNYSVYGTIDNANLAETLQRLEADVADATTSQKTDFQINSNFVDFIEGLEDDSHIYYVPENYNYIFVKNILIPFTAEQKAVLSNLQKQQGSTTTPEYLAKCKELASQIIADDYNNKDADGNYAKISDVFKLDADGNISINFENAELGQFFNDKGQVVPMENKTAEETIIELMKRFNTDTASHSSLYDYVVRVGEVPESYSAPWVDEFVDAANDAYNVANGVAGTTYGIAISTYGVHIVFYSADVKAETFDFNSNWLNTSTSEYRLFKAFFSTESDELLEEDADALNKVYYESKISKTDIFDKFLSDNGITFDFEESISLDTEEE